MTILRDMLQAKSAQYDGNHAQVVSGAELARYVLTPSEWEAMQADLRKLSQKNFDARTRSAIIAPKRL